MGADVDPAIAKTIREDFYPKKNILPDRIEGMDAVMADAVAFKFIAAPLSKDQLQH